MPQGQCILWELTQSHTQYLWGICSTCGNWPLGHMQYLWELACRR